MITTDKVTEIFCILDEFCKNLDAELTKNLHIAPIDEGYKGSVEKRWGNFLN